MQKTRFFAVVLLAVSALARSGLVPSESTLPAIPLDPSEQSRLDLARQTALAGKLKVMMEYLTDIAETTGEVSAIRALLGHSQDPDAQQLLMALEALLDRSGLSQSESESQSQAQPAPADSARLSGRSLVVTALEKTPLEEIALEKTPPRRPPENARPATPPVKKPLVITLAVATTDGLAGKINVEGGRVVREGESFTHQGIRYTVQSIRLHGKTVAGLSRFKVILLQPGGQATTLLFPAEG